MADPPSVVRVGFHVGGRPHSGLDLPAQITLISQVRGAQKGEVTCSETQSRWALDYRLEARGP